MVIDQSGRPVGDPIIEEPASPGHELQKRVDQALAQVKRQRKRN